MKAAASLAVRLATMDDLDPLAGLVEQYRQFYKQALSDGTRPYLKDRISRNESVILVAEKGAQLVGFTQCYPTFSTVSLSSIWLLNDLFVDPAHRGEHVADQLMQVAEATARKAGASRIWLRTAHTNAAAQALYEKRGWIRDEVFQRYDLVF